MYMGSDGFERRYLQQAQEEITAILASDDSVYLALEEWTVTITEAHEVHADVDPADLIYFFVDNLYDLLPAIRAARQSFALEIQTNAHIQARKTSETEIPQAGLNTMINPPSMF